MHDLGPVLARLDGDRKLLQDIVERHLSGWKERLSQLRERIEAQAWNEAQDAARQLSSTLLILDAFEGYMRAQKIHNACARADTALAVRTLWELELALSVLEADLRRCLEESALREQPALKQRDSGAWA